VVLGQADHFLTFTGSTRAEVVAAQVGNLRHPDRPGFEDLRPYGERLGADVVDRTETAGSQAQCFLATELVLRAQKDARRVSLGG
jgi:hypothetical protein